MAGRKTVTEQVEIPVAADEGAPVAVEVTDATPAPDGAVVYEVDPTTPEGQLIEALLTDIDGYRARVMALEDTLDAATREGDALAPVVAENGALAFVFRGGMGRDDVVALPEREPGQTHLVLTGSPQVDQLGRWDLHAQPFAFAWEDPTNLPELLPRCCVTGEGCATVASDLGYCVHCPGCTPAFLRSVGVDVPDEVVTEDSDGDAG